MDSICSAIAYAYLKTIMGLPDVVAARAGNTNERIDFVLDRFGFAPPLFLSDVSPRVADVMQTEVHSATANTVIYEALQLMEQHGLRGLPITDEENHLLGMLSALSITSYLLPPREKIGTIREVTTSLSAITSCFGGKILNSEAQTEITDLYLLVGAMSAESFRERIQRYKGKKVVLLVGDRPNIQRTAIEAGAYALIATGGTRVKDSVLQAANDAGVLVATSPLDTATTILLSRGAIESRDMVESQFLQFRPTAPIESARQQAMQSSGFAFPVTDLDGTLCGILSKSDFLKPIPRQLVLVDHNELVQAVKGADRVPILEILDHHKVGGFSSTGPMLFWNNPVGSTSTIVALCFEQAGVAIPANIAGLLMAGLISDTLNLTSPTATPVDKRILEKLARIAGEEPAALAEAIFAVGSPLLTLEPTAVVNTDCKDYEEEGRKFSVAQIEELSFANFHSRTDAVLEALEAHRSKSDLVFSALMVTDINTQNSILAVVGDEDFLETIDYPAKGPNLWQLDGVVSRKKQLLPYLLEKLEQVPISA